MKELCEKCATRRACQIEVLSAYDVAYLCGWCSSWKQGKPKKKQKTNVVALDLDGICAIVRHSNILAVLAPTSVLADHKTA